MINSEYGKQINLYKGAIDDYKPDIIIVNVRSFYIIIFRNLYIKEKIK